MSPNLHLVATYLISRLLSEKRWYPVSLKSTRILTSLIRPWLGETPDRSLWMLDYWLKNLFSYERPFHIPICTLGEEAIFAAKENPGGTAVISVHLPLAILVLRSLVDIGCAPTAVLSHGGYLRGGKFPVGAGEGLPGLTPGPTVLVRARSVLRRGGLVAAMIDTQLGAPLNTNMLDLLGSVGARAVFALAWLQADGEIVVEYYNPPDPFCTSKEGILSNIEFFRGKVKEHQLAHCELQSETARQPPAPKANNLSGVDASS